MTSAMAKAPWLEPKWLEQPWKSNVAFSITRRSCVEGGFGKKAGCIWTATYVATYVRKYVRTYLYATFKYVYVRASPYVVHVRPYLKKKKQTSRGARASGPAWARGGASACPFTPVRGLLVRLSLSKWGPPLADDSCGCFLVSIVLFCVRNLDPTDVRSPGLKSLRACHPYSRPKPVHA